MNILKNLFENWWVIPAALVLTFVIPALIYCVVIVPIEYLKRLFREPLEGMAKAFFGILFK